MDLFEVVIFTEIIYLIFTTGYFLVAHQDDIRY